MSAGVDLPEPLDLIAAAPVAQVGCRPPPVMGI